MAQTSATPLNYLLKSEGSSLTITQTAVDQRPAPSKKERFPTLDVMRGLSILGRPAQSRRAGTTTTPSGRTRRSVTLLQQRSLPGSNSHGVNPAHSFTRSPARQHRPISGRRWMKVGVTSDRAVARVGRRQNRQPPCRPRLISAWGPRSGHQRVVNTSTPMRATDDGLTYMDA